MFDESLKITYDEVALQEPLAELIATMISKDPMLLKVIKEIARHDRLILSRTDKQLDEDFVYGIRKEDIRLSIVTGYKIEKKGKNAGKKVKTNPAIKIIDDAVSFLMGATLIYYERNVDRKKRYLFTSRALEVLSVLNKKGCISLVDIISDAKK